MVVRCCHCEPDKVNVDNTAVENPLLGTTNSTQFPALRLLRLPTHPKTNSMPGVVHVPFEVPDTFRVFGLSVRSRIPGPYAEKFAREKLGSERLPSTPDADFRWILEGGLHPLQRFPIPDINPYDVTIPSRGCVAFNQEPI